MLMDMWWNTIRPNSNTNVTTAPKISGMIDARAYCNSSKTWPVKQKYVLDMSTNIDSSNALKKKVQNLSTSTRELGNTLVGFNTNMYKNMTSTNEEKIIPSLIIVSTQDMEYAHFGGYEGKKLRPVEQCWDDKNGQVEDTDAAARDNPLRLFPLYSFDPRRYNNTSWVEPFKRIVDPSDKNCDASRIWLGFSMNPLLGYRPFDELCPCLKDFYTRCEEKYIPIHAHCAPAGFIAEDAQEYSKKDQRLKGKRFNSNIFVGREDVTNDTPMNHFYKNYGHPQNWRHVLESFPDIYLCLSSFGGNSEWKHESMREWVDNDMASLLPPREWIRTMIILANKYPNVYIDISGLDIFNKYIEKGLTRLINDKKNRLRDKLIFGSDWYFSNISSDEYGQYCNKYKIFFDGIENGLWEQVSFVNTCRCYTLTEKKILAMSNNLGVTNDVRDNLVQVIKDVKRLVVAKPEIYGQRQRKEKSIKNSGEVVREINLRLAGFGGLLPMDIFTQQTENGVEQFQVDYMIGHKKEWPDGLLGFVDQKTLEAIEDFSKNYREILDNYKCPCDQCGGFGGLDKWKKKKYPKGNVYSGDEGKNPYEYPGMHQSLLWAVSAVRFYTIHYCKLPENQGYHREKYPHIIEKIYSGYRCWENNYSNERNTTNHMGKAVDIHFVGIPSGNFDPYNNESRAKMVGPDMIENVFEQVVKKYLKAQKKWGNTNLFSVEPIGIKWVKPRNEINKNFKCILDEIDIATGNNKSHIGCQLRVDKCSQAIDSSKKTVAYQADGTPRCVYDIEDNGIYTPHNGCELRNGEKCCSQVLDLGFTTTWIHLDVRAFNREQYLKDEFFIKENKTGNFYKAMSEIDIGIVGRENSRRLFYKPLPLRITQ